MVYKLPAREVVENAPSLTIPCRGLGRCSSLLRLFAGLFGLIAWFDVVWLACFAWSSGFLVGLFGRKKRSHFGEMS